ncbi:MAG: HIT domain-containing protein [Candidatus Micrarchaeota archaeon]|nr:HIT domain-containing protein [Candidatus Micrarchaeota archaeon]
MEHSDCIFCKIAAGKVPAYRIYEDKDYLAFLDIFPNIEGQSLVITKRHVESLFSKLEDKELSEFIITTKKVANLIRKRLGVARVHLVLEGTGVNHFHAKLYPSSGMTDSEFKEVIAAERVFFKEYPGYVTTLMGPQADAAALEKVQKKITGE